MEEGVKGEHRGTEQTACVRLRASLPADSINTWFPLLSPSKTLQTPLRHDSSYSEDAGETVQFRTTSGCRALTSCANINLTHALSINQLSRDCQAPPLRLWQTFLRLNLDRRGSPPPPPPPDLRMLSWLHKCLLEI